MEPRCFRQRIRQREQLLSVKHVVVNGAYDFIHLCKFKMKIFYKKLVEPMKPILKKQNLK